MGERKDVKRVKRAIKKLEKAAKKGTVNRLQRQFEAIEEGLRAGALQPPKLFKDVPITDYVEGSGEDGNS